jgi:hypothetical protein
MWVRIDEVSFDSEQTAGVVDHTRNTAVLRHDGDGFRGFRLLVDGPSGRALDVSYWDTESGARAGKADPSTDPVGAAATTVVRSNIYEMAIDSV